MAMRWRWSRELGGAVKLLGLFAATGLLAACVSTQTGGFSEQRNRDKALDYSVQLARQYISAGEWDDARRHLKKALEIDAGNSSVHGTMALVFQNTGELERAEEHFERALDLDRGNSQVRNNYAVFLYEEQRYEEAERELARVVEDVHYDRRAEAFLNLGIVRQRLGEWQDSLSPLERALRLNQRSPAAALKLALTRYELGDYARAQELYKRYRSMRERQSAEALWLGIRLAKRFDDEDAFASYALALRNLYPHSQEYLAFREQYGDGGEL